MRKGLVYSCIILISLVLSGCNMDNIEQEYKEGVIIHIDKETGCEYLINTQHGGMTPRYEVTKGKTNIVGCKGNLGF